MEPSAFDVYLEVYSRTFCRFLLLQIPRKCNVRSLLVQEVLVSPNEFQVGSGSDVIVSLNFGQELFTQQAGGGVKLLAQINATTSLFVCHLNVPEEPSSHSSQGIFWPCL